MSAETKCPDCGETWGHKYECISVRILREGLAPAAAALRAPDCDWTAAKDFDARAVYFCANRAKLDETNPQEVAYRKRAREIGEALLRPAGEPRPVAEQAIANAWLDEQHDLMDISDWSDLAPDEQTLVTRMVHRFSAPAPVAVSPEATCSCAEWEPGTAKLNAPIHLAQARNPHLIGTPEFQFTPFRFCPWCGGKSRAALGSPTEEGNDARI